MSDLVGNPEDRFSRVAAQFFSCIMKEPSLARYEPRRERTGLRGFRPGPTQTDLYSHRNGLEA